MKKGEDEKLKSLSKEEIDREINAMNKIYECYCFLLQNTGSDDVLHKKIDSLGREHLLSKLNEIKFSAEIVYQNKLQELEKRFKKM